MYNDNQVVIDETKFNSYINSFGKENIKEIKFIKKDVKDISDKTLLDKLKFFSI